MGSHRGLRAESVDRVQASGTLSERKTFSDELLASEISHVVTDAAGVSAC